MLNFNSKIVHIFTGTCTLLFFFLQRIKLFMKREIKPLLYVQEAQRKVYIITFVCMNFDIAQLSDRCPAKQAVNAKLAFVQLYQVGDEQVWIFPYC